MAVQGAYVRRDSVESGGDEDRTLHLVKLNWFGRMQMNNPARAAGLAMERGAPNVRTIGFNRDAYLSELQRNGIHVGTNYIEPRVPMTAAFIGDLIGAGTRDPS